MGNFDCEDLALMLRFESIFNKMDNCINAVRDEFQVHFGKIEKSDRAILSTLKKYHCYWLCLENGSRFNKLGYGFNFLEDGNAKPPSLFLQVDVNVKSVLYQELLDCHEKYGISMQIYEEDNSVCVFWLDSPLSDYLSSDNQTDKICNWFKDSFRIFSNVLI